MHSLKLFTGINAQLLHLFACRIFRAFQHIAHVQRPAGYFQKGQSGALRVFRDFIDLRRKRRRVGGHHGVIVQALQKRIHAGEFQRGAEQTREHMPRTNRRGNGGRLHAVGIVEFAEQRFVTFREGFKKSRRLQVGKINARFAELAAQLTQYECFVRAVKIHFVDEQKTRHMVFFQKLPKGTGVALYAVRAADDKHCVIQYLQSAFGFGRKVNMTRRVK